MIPNHQERVVEEKGVTDSRDFGISVDDSAHIMSILRDQLYTDKHMAILREYSANAWDANREAGKADVPIKVTMPTVADPNLTIRDFGPGLSHDGMFEVYTQYGKSTKRNSNLAVGMLGIGSKSGFSYSDSFTITSWHAGTKRVYAAVLDQSEKGRVNLLFEEPCGDETGIEIQIPIKTADIPVFMTKARDLFRHFRPRPVINLDLPPDDSKRISLKHGTIITHDYHSYNHEWFAIMGCIPYKIDMKQVQGKVADFVWRISGELKFDIGEVTISASREELKYSDKTKEAIVKKLEKLVDEFVLTTLECMKDPNMTDWQKRLRSVVVAQLNLPVPKELKDMVGTYVKMEYEDDSIIWRGSIPVSDKTRIVVKDDLRKINGFQTQPQDQIVEIQAGKTVDEALTSVDLALEKAKAKGVTVIKLSTIPWIAPYVKPKKQRELTEVHKANRLVLNADRGWFGPPFAKCWTVEDSVPSDDDVFCIVHGFRSQGGYDVFNSYEQDKTIAELAGMKLPKIYGYKTRANKPVGPEDCDGTHYPEWRKTFHATALKKLEKELSDHLWASRVGDYRDAKAARERLSKYLAEDHAVIKTLKLVERAIKTNKNIDWNTRQKIDRAARRLEAEKTDLNPDTVLKQAFENYPLLQLSTTGLDAILSPENEAWAQYMQLVDGLWAAAKEEA